MENTIKSKVNVYTLEEMQEILTKSSIHKIIFWVGAGIDSGYPTCLPLGNGLTNYMLKLACGTKLDKVINEWEKNADLLRKASAESLYIPDRPRLETVVQAIREYEENNNFIEDSLLKGLQAFSTKECLYNKEHLILAQCLHFGANIVTTNYSDFIYKAYKDEYGEESIYEEYMDMHTYCVNNIWNSCIYHVHGIYSDLKTIGANLRDVKKSLPDSFKEKLRMWIANGYTFIFIGYCGSDTLDINPFLKSIKLDNKATGIYVRHCRDEKVLEVKNNEKVLLNPFENKYVCSCITSCFLDILDKENINFKVKKENLSEKWTDKFSKYTKGYTEEQVEVFLLGLCYWLGIPITKIMNVKSWKKIIQKNNMPDNWYKCYYTFANASMIKQRTIIKKQAKKLNVINNQLMISDYRAARGKKYKLEKEPDILFVQNIEKRILEKESIDWEISTTLNRYIDYVFVKNIKLFSFYHRKNNNYDLEGVEWAKEGLEKIIDAGYDSVIDVNQINTAYRSLALSQSLLRKEDIQKINSYLDIALENYIDVSSLNGVAICLLYKSMVWLKDYEYNHIYESLDNANKNWTLASKVIFKGKMKKYYKKCNLVRAWRRKCNMYSIYWKLQNKVRK